MLENKQWQKEGTQKTREVYNEAKRAAKRLVAQKKEQRRKDLENELTGPEGKKRAFQMARQTAKDRQDVVGVPCIRGEDGNLVTSLKERLGVWKNYMSQLLNVENPWNGLAVAEAVQGPCEAVTIAEVEKALRCNKKGKLPDLAVLQQR